MRSPSRCLGLALATLALAAPPAAADVATVVESTDAEEPPPGPPFELGLRLATLVSTHGLDTEVDPVSAFRRAAQTDLPFEALLQASSPTGVGIDLGLRAWLPFAWASARPWVSGGAAIPAARASGQHPSETLSSSVLIPRQGDTPVPGRVASPSVGIDADWRAFGRAGLEWRLDSGAALGPFLGFEAQRFVVTADGVALSIDSLPLVATRWAFEGSDTAWGIHGGLAARFPITRFADIDLALSYTEFLTEHEFAIGSKGLAELDPVPLGFDPGGSLQLAVGVLFRFGAADELRSSATRSRTADEESDGR